MIDIKLIEPTKMNLYELEDLRLNCFEIEGINPSETYYYKILQKNMLIIGAYDDNRIVGALYLDEFYRSIYVEQLFVDKEYRNQHIGESLIKSIKDYQEYINQIFKIDYQIINLESLREAEGFYEKIGFRRKKNQGYYKYL